MKGKGERIKGEGKEKKGRENTPEMYFWLRS